MRYAERPAGPFLQSLVDRFWVLETSTTDPSLVQPVLPDGHVEIMAHVGAPFAELGVDGREHTQAKVLIGAQMTESARLVTRPSAFIVGARLRPHAAVLLTGVPQHLLTGKSHELASVNRALATKVSQHLSGRHDALNLMDAFEQILTAALREPSATASGWADVAARLGFYDQAHFINDFKHFTGETPGACPLSDLPDRR